MTQTVPEISLASWHLKLAIVLASSVITLLISIGYIVTPLLFSLLPSKLAGEVASALFQYVAVMSLLAFSGLALQSCKHKQRLAKRWHWLLSIIIMSVLLFGLAPWMAEIKSAYPQGISHDSIDWKLFSALHGVYQLGYLTVLLLTLYGLYKIWRFNGLIGKA